MIILPVIPACNSLRFVHTGEGVISFVGKDDLYNLTDTTLYFSFSFRNLRDRTLLVTPEFESAAWEGNEEILRFIKEHKMVYDYSCTGDIPDHPDIKYLHVPNMFLHFIIYLGHEIV